MKSRKQTFLVWVFICFSQLLRAESFKEFNLKVSEETSVDKLNIYALNELKKYTETGKVYYLYNSKYTEFFIASREHRSNESLKLLSWIIEDGKNSDSEQLAWVNFHLASVLASLNANKISQDYALNSLRIAKKRNDLDMLGLAYSLIGTNYYKQNDFNTALTNYKMAHKFYSSKNLLYEASMLNNIALCKMNLKDNVGAYEYHQKALKILSAIKNKNKSEEIFEVVVKGNIGTILNKLGKHDQAIKLLEEELDYYFSHTDQLGMAIPTSIELLKLYQLQANFSKADDIVNKIIYLEKNVVQPTEFPLLTEALYNFYSEMGMQAKALNLSKKLIKKLNDYSNLKIGQSNELNEILYRDKLAHIRKDSRAQKIILDNAISEKKKSQLLSIVVIIVGILISAIAVLVFVTIKKNSRKNSLIQNQKQEIESNKNKILESEIRLNQDKIASLAMNLSLKKETEKAFLTKINELKRKKNVDTEQTIKDLQLSVTNLLSIDKKMIYTDLESDEVNKKFKLRLKTLFPGLSKTDLEYCCHFRLNLSAKQIGSIQGVSDVSVRVVKNRIKNKLGLNANQSLNDYLNGLSLS